MRGLCGLGVALLVGSGLVVGSGCARNAPAAPGPRELSQTVAVSAATAGSRTLESSDAGAQTPAGAPDDFRTALRMQSFRRAAALIDALPERERRAPRVRFARARAALELGDNARVVQELAGLEEALPIVSEEVRRYRALAQLEIGPYPEAAEYFSARSAPEELLNAALAYERAGQRPKARTMLDRALARSKKRDVGLIARIRHARARVAAELGQTTLAVSDLRWLATEVPTSPVADGVDATLAELSPKQALTADERYDRALSLALEGKVEATRRELSLLGKSGKLPDGELLRAEGWALYMARSDYARAAELLAEASQKGSRHAVKDLFYSARSLSRDDQDELAIQRYEELSRRHPSSNYAEQALYYAARLRYIGGRWNEAVSAYSSLLKRFGKRSRFADEAEYERAVARLAAQKELKQAAAAFKALASREPDTRIQAQYLELAAVALERSGDGEAAVEGYRRVIAQEPLSFAALAAAARLRARGLEVPPMLGPAEAGAASAQLDVELPARVKFFHELGLDTDAESALIDSEGLLRTRHAPRSEESLCSAYGLLSVASRRYRIGQRAASWQALEKAPSPRSSWLWDCVYPRPYAALVGSLAERYRLEPELIYAVMRQESAFRPAVVSPASAVGLMQIIPPTARRAAEEAGVAFDPALVREELENVPKNVELGSFYLRKLLDQFDGRIELSAAAYNAGPRTVARWLKSGENLSLDVFVARIPYRETRHYVQRVVGNYARYLYLTGGEQAVPALSLSLPQDLSVPDDAY